MYRGLVCDAAERVFAAHGLFRARMSQIAHESGVSIGTIYRVFPGRKNEIYRAIQENRGTELLGRTRAIGEAAWRQSGDLLAAILAGIAATVDFFAEHPDHLRVVLREEKGWAGSSNRSSAEQTAIWREGVDGIVTAIQFGIAQGLLVDDDAQAMARTWVGIQEAHLGYWVERGMGATAGEVAARLQRQMLRAFCRPEVLATRRLPEVTTTPDRQPTTPPLAGRTPESGRATERRRVS
jgi:AcrR family transcriptional regulator